MIKTIKQQKTFGEFPFWYKLVIRNDFHTCKPNQFAVWTAKVHEEVERECLKRGLTRQEAIDFVNNHETIIRLCK